MHMIEGPAFIALIVSMSLVRGPGKVVMVSGEILSLSLQAVIEEKCTDTITDRTLLHLMLTFVHIHDQWRRYSKYMWDVICICDSPREARSPL